MMTTKENGKCNFEQDLHYLYNLHSKFSDHYYYKALQNSNVVLIGWSEHNSYYSIKRHVH